MIENTLSKRSGDPDAPFLVRQESEPVRPAENAVELIDRNRIKLDAVGTTPPHEGD